MSDQLNNSEDFLARWLSGELTPEEQAQFESSEDAKEFSAIIDSVEKISLPEYDVEAQLLKIKEKRATPQTKETKTVWFSGLTKYAAAAIVIIGITLVYFLTRPNYIVYETMAGQVENITLPDQSIVTLNANSRLRYDPDNFDQNRLLLLDGEAFFEVTKGINFEVKTDQGTVRVLGTSFNIWNRNKLLDVVCYTGKVNVSKKSYTKDLTPGDGLRVNNGQIKRSWTKQLQNEKPVWIVYGVTELEDVNLKEALNELSNVFGIEIESNSELNSIPFTGTFPNDDIEAAIGLVLSPNNIDYEYDTENNKLVLKGIKGQ